MGLLGGCPFAFSKMCHEIFGAEKEPSARKREREKYLFAEKLF
jgi:hypothetical protein